jgi:hypothetical protein
LEMWGHLTHLWWTITNMKKNVSID